MPPWLQNGSEFGEEGLDLQFDECLVQIAQLRYEMLKLMKTSRTSLRSGRGVCRTGAQSLLKEAQDIDRNLSDWAQALPQQWTYKVHLIEKPFLCDISYSDTIHIYSSKEHSTLWNRYRGARLATNSIINKLLDHSANPLGPENLAEQDLARRNIQTFVDDICASVAFCLGRVVAAEPPIVLDKDTGKKVHNVSARQAFLLSWPLIIASATSVISEHQRRWIQSQIMVVGQITGSGLLQSLASGK